MTIGQRQYIESWWVFFESDSYPDVPSPRELLAWIEYANDNPDRCDYILSKEYQEYTPQL